jgi:hypothetical protein
MFFLLFGLFKPVEGDRDRSRSVHFISRLERQR